MTPEQPTLSVLICSLNCRAHLERCFASLYESGDHGVDFETILVDNDSSDGTVDLVRERWPQVHVVANRGNVGFAHANNQALERARGTYVLYLNPDTEVGEGTLRRCVDELKSDPKIGLVGCRLIWPDGEIQYECARRGYRLGDVFIGSLYLNRFFPRHPLFGRQLIGDWDHRDSRDVEAISGAFMMLPRALAEELGGMATEVFLYHEDMDLPLRILQRGYRVRYLADVQTVHHTSRSTTGWWLKPDWALLELESTLRLVRQGQGRLAAGVARAAYGVRSLLRMAIAATGPLLPGPRRRYPIVFSMRHHVLQLAWAVSPRLVRHRLPRAPHPADLPAPIEYLPGQRASALPGSAETTRSA